MSPRRLALLALALGVRLVGVAWADREVVDVLRYRKVADHVLDVSWNPYRAPRLYPYPPVWVWVEAGSGWLARHAGLSFPVVVKLPVVAADLLIVALLARAGREGAAWLYAVHPVSVLITGFHGQFDSLALLFVLLALYWQERGRRDAGALSLAAAIALKGFPLLLLPLFLLQGEWKQRARFLALATLPVAVLLLPYAADDLPALRRELLGYGGVADFGWIGLHRGLAWLRTGVLARSEARHWEFLVAVSKAVFLTAYGAMLAALVRRRLAWTLPEASLAVFLAFLAFYGSVSAQYLLWVVPLGVLFADRFLAAHGAASTLALLGFYPFLAPGVLWPPGAGPLPQEEAGVLWVAGVGAVWIASAAWLAALLHRGRDGAGPGRCIIAGRERPRSGSS